MIGNLGFMVNPLKLKAFTQDWNVHIKMVTRGQNKARLNRFEDHKPEDIKWMLDLLQSRVATIKAGIFKKRGDNCTQFLDSAGFCFGKEAKSLGIVDAVVDSPEVYLQMRFGNEIQIKMNKANWKEKFGLSSELVESVFPEEKSLVEELEDLCAVKVLA